MPVLSATRIRERLSTGDLSTRLIITPLLDVAHQLKPGNGSIDLRLGFRFSAATRSKQSVSDLYVGNMSVDMESYYVPLGGYFVLHPRHFVLGQTLEYLSFPSDLCAYVIGRSSWGRLGLVIATAMGVHPGYRGTLTLELTNLGEIPLKLFPGSSIVQLFVHTVDQDLLETSNTGSFVGSTRPEAIGSDVEDKVIQRVKALADTRRRRTP